MENRRSNMSCWASGLVRKILHGTPGLTRTADTRFRKPLLYPLSYRGIDSRQSREPPSHPRELPAGMLPTGRRRVKARLQRGGPRRHGLAMRAQLWGRSIERPLSVPKGGFEPPLGLPELRPERSASAIPPLRHEPRGGSRGTIIAWVPGLHKGSLLFRTTVAGFVALRDGRYT